jgi:glycosyltransferase involved in cell wall biosynthesis
MDKVTPHISIILPACNERANLDKLLPELFDMIKAQPWADACEVIVVNDGSTDTTAELAEEYFIRMVTHRRSLGNGAAIKSGARAAKGEIIICMDADGQHNPADIPRLLAAIEAGADMAVGARSDDNHASAGRSFANRFYNWLSSVMTNSKVQDLTSGFRAVYRKKFLDFLSLLPNGFSYPTTITMSFFRAGYGVEYVPIVVRKRGGKSHIKPIRDGFRFVLIIFRIATLYSPLKLFVPLAAGFFATGLGYYLYTFAMTRRFTNMSMLLFITAMLIFLIGLVSEQVSQLIFMSVQRRRDEAE